MERDDLPITVMDSALNGGFKTWPAAFAALCMLCEENEISIRFGYHSGWFVKPKEGSNDPHEMGDPFLDEDCQGFTIEVGMHSFANEDGGEIYYKKPSWAVHDGLRLLKSVLQDRNEDSP